MLFKLMYWEDFGGGLVNSDSTAYIESIVKLSGVLISENRVVE